MRGSRRAESPCEGWGAVGEEGKQRVVRHDGHPGVEVAAGQLAAQVKHIDSQQIAASGDLNFDAHSPVGRVALGSSRRPLIPVMLVLAQVVVLPAAAALARRAGWRRAAEWLGSRQFLREPGSSVATSSTAAASPKTDFRAALASERHHRKLCRSSARARVSGVAPAKSRSGSSIGLTGSISVA